MGGEEPARASLSMSLRRSCGPARANSIMFDDACAFCTSFCGKEEEEEAGTKHKEEVDDGQEEGGGGQQCVQDQCENGTTGAPRDHHYFRCQQRRRQPLAQGGKQGSAQTRHDTGAFPDAPPAGLGRGTRAPSGPTPGAWRSGT